MYQLRKFAHFFVCALAASVAFIFLFIPSFLFDSYISGDLAVFLFILSMLCFPGLGAVFVFKFCSYKLNFTALYNPDIYKPISRPPLIMPYVADLSTIDCMDGHQFEYWCADLLRNLGYVNVVVTQGSGDQGVDVLATKNGITYAIQCKCYSSDLGNTPVQEVYTGKAIYNCHIGVVMTNVHFTAGGKQAAAATGVLLWDRDWLINALASTTPLPDILVQKNSLLFDVADFIIKFHTTNRFLIKRRFHLDNSAYNDMLYNLQRVGVIGPLSSSGGCVIYYNTWTWLAAKNKLLFPTISSTNSAAKKPIPASISLSDFRDDLLPNAVDIIMETGVVSVSILTERLKLGYARAARIIDELEEHGFVGPFQGSKPRYILITPDVWDRIKQNNPSGL